ncbi:DUF6326 family protein [Methanolobus sp. WCC4]|uniref:DUF6326 family protein n=1 Tax=Methanolobus sp. WCC4 TaxID=3125784 RepID=UPI0030F4EAFA
MEMNDRSKGFNGLVDWKIDRKVLLSTLWIFALLNYLYCDILTLMDASVLNQFLTGTVEGMQITQDLLLAGSVLMEIPIAMVLLSRVLKYRVNRWANMISGFIMTVVQAATLISPSTSYYTFFSIIEIATTLVIFAVALKWTEPGEMSSL